MKSDHGLLVNIILGIIGAFVGGLIAMVIPGLHPAGSTLSIGSIVLAIIGALVVLFIYGLMGLTGPKTAVRGNWRLPAIGVGLMVVSAIAIGGIYPAVVQRFQVTPNAQDFEEEYIQRNIDGTRAAFGLDQTETQAYDATTQTQEGALADYEETTSNIRLLDPEIISPTFTQLQQLKNLSTRSL